MNKKRIILSALVGTIALTALSISISLAWYASSNALSVSSIDVRITSSHHLKISTSTEETSFVSDLAYEDLNKLENDFLFAPVSTMYREKWMSQFDDTPRFYDCSNYLTTSDGVPHQDIIGNGFYQQKIYLMSDISYNASLDPKDCIFEVNEAANEKRAEKILKDNPDLELTKEEVIESLNNLLNSLRVSILVPDETYYRYYIIDPIKQKGEETVFGGLLDNNHDGFYDTYEYLTEERETKEKETIYGEVNDRSLIVYNDPLREKNPNEDEEYRKQGLHYYGNSFQGEHKETAFTYNEEASLANGLEFAKEGAYSLEEIDDPNTSLLIPCYAYEPREIVISIYLEGWDLDCINATMGASFETKLSFKLLGGIV